MLFLIFGNVKILFAEKKLIWRSYTTVKALPIIKKMEFIDKKEFAKAFLDENSKTFVIYVEILEALIIKMTIYPSQTDLIINDDPV